MLLNKYEIDVYFFIACLVAALDCDFLGKLYSLCVKFHSPIIAFKALKVSEGEVCKHRGGCAVLQVLVPCMSNLGSLMNAV